MNLEKPLIGNVLLVNEFRQKQNPTAEDAEGHKQPKAAELARANADSELARKEVSMR